MDYMLTQPTGVESLVLSGPALSVPRYMADVKGLLAALPKDVQDTIARHEAAGTTDSPEYQQATQVFYKRHLSRLDPWPPKLEKTFADFGTEVYSTVQGPSEFTVTGWIKDYDRTSRLGELHLPVLFTAGRYDKVTPAQAEYYAGLVSDGQLTIFEQSAHMTMLDETDRYIDVVRTFLASVDHKR